MLVATILVVVVLSLVVIREAWRRRSLRWRMLMKFPGDFPWPFVGNALQLGFHVDEAPAKIMALWEKHGKSNFRMLVGSEDWVFLCEPDDIGTILSHQTELSKTPERNAAMIPFFGHSVSTSEGEKWRCIRKLMAPSFNFNTLESRVATTNKHCKYLMEILENHGSDPIALYRYIRPFMFDVITSTLMGTDYDYLSDRNHPYFAASGKIIEIASTNYFSYWRNIESIFRLTSIYREMMDTIQVVYDMSDKVIRDRKFILKSKEKEIVNNNKNINVNLDDFVHESLSANACLLDSLILGKFPSGLPIPDHMIREEVTLLCFTGQYTTAMTICNVLYCLAKYPEIQKRVFEEQQSVFRGDTLRDPNTQDLNEMKYLEAVIKETMRAIPTVPKLGRSLKEDLTLRDGRVIPAGATVIVFYEGLFLNDKVFPEPEKYNPERFLENMHTFAFVPFSAGPRNCIGFRFAWVAMKATLSNILRRFEVSEVPGAEPRFAYRIITESTNDIQLKLTKRV